MRQIFLDCVTRDGARTELMQTRYTHRSILALTPKVPPTSDVSVMFGPFIQEWYKQWGRGQKTVIPNETKNQMPSFHLRKLFAGNVFMVAIFLVFVLDDVYHAFSKNVQEVQK